MQEEMGEPPSFDEDDGHEPSGLENDDEALAGPACKKARPASPPAITIGASALQEAADALALLLTDSQFLAA